MLESGAQLKTIMHSRPLFKTRGPKANHSAHLLKPTSQMKFKLTLKGKESPRHEHSLRSCSDGTAILPFCLGMQVLGPG